MIRRLEDAALESPEMVDRGLEERPGDDLAGDAAGRVDATEAVESGRDELLGGLRLGQIEHPVGGRHRRSQRLELVDQPLLGVADDKVVSPSGQLPGQRRTDRRRRCPRGPPGGRSTRCRSRVTSGVAVGLPGPFRPPAS
ncbi:MAG: hypothetical protein U5R31_15035 [Acidimicrobiia bacterium]|nr:hypothetical protein [Acidimicrobiia bacterium]